MNLSIWNKRDPLGINSLAALKDEMDRTFDRFLGSPFGFGTIEPALLRAEGWMPPLDVSETDNEVTIRAELPGVATKDLDISVTGRTLSLAGKKEEVTEKKEENFYQCERRFGSFRRMIDLPDSVDAEKVTAESDNGVVTIHVAKKPNARPKQVEVKSIGKKVPVTG